MTSAIRESVLVKRPKWAIRSIPRVDADGILVASCPPGIAATADEAIDWYKRHKPHAAKWHDLRAFPA